jgi:hypothetical protein
MKTNEEFGHHLCPNHDGKDMFVRGKGKFIILVLEPRRISLWFVTNFNQLIAHFKITRQTAFDLLALLENISTFEEEILVQSFFETIGKSRILATC